MPARRSFLISVCLLQEGITVKDVSFGYDEKKPILVHMNAEFKKGGKYALTGPSGCGKSTLLKILLAGCQATRARSFMTRETCGITRPSSSSRK